MTIPKATKKLIKKRVQEADRSEQLAIWNFLKISRAIYFAMVENRDKTKCIKPDCKNPPSDQFTVLCKEHDREFWSWRLQQ